MFAAAVSLIVRMSVFIGNFLLECQINMRCLFDICIFNIGIYLIRRTNYWKPYSNGNAFDYASIMVQITIHEPCPQKIRVNLNQNKKPNYPSIVYVKYYHLSVCLERSHWEFILYNRGVNWLCMMFLRSFKSMAIK